MELSVFHLGGNGHASVRLEAAREALARGHDPIRLVDIPYPGFEGRPRATSFDGFLDAIEVACRAEATRPASAIATGIGALFALEMRARGALDLPLIFQGPVLWGLERRLMPRLLRWGPARAMLSRAFVLPRFQARFVRQQFRRPLAESARARFFDGYARCSAFGDLFDWIGPAWLRTLERRFATTPEALGSIRVWLGGRDRVVGRLELEATERALGVRWPVTRFPDWGHYPMIDVPREWADALRDALAAP